MEYKDVAAAVEMPLNDFYDWMQSFEEDYIVVDETDEDTGEKYKSVVYTDGDEGVMVIGTSKEGRNGFSIQLVQCAYVEFTPNMMRKMLKELK